MLTSQTCLPCSAKTQADQVNKELELVILRAAKQTEAHLAKYGQGERLFKVIQTMLIESYKYCEKSVAGDAGEITVPKVEMV